jgi:cell division protein FtsI (penicillin-binding protein 3)
VIRAHRIWTTTFLSLIFFALVAGRLGYLQIYCHAALQERVNREQSRARGDSEVPPRGAILDRTGAVLAMSIQGGACFADPHRVLSADETAHLLAPLLHQPANIILDKLTRHKRPPNDPAGGRRVRGDRFVWLARRLDPETAEQVKALKRPGVTVTTDIKRFYPEESFAAQVLGVVGDNHQGLSGVELMADRWLSARSVPFLFKQWAFGKVKNAALTGRSDLAPHSVVLTLDRALQTIAEQELADQMQRSKPKSGTVIIQDPQTGEILAMATAPAFNPNLWGSPLEPAEYGPEALKNPAVEHVFEPGSTFKIVTAAAALEERRVSLGDSFFCEDGSWDIPGRTIHDHEKEGWLTFAQVISHSSNIGTAKVARRVGRDPLYRYARAFGFGMPSGCGLPGDGVGILRPTREWRQSSLETISFGQEVGATPLQMVNAYSAIASGGWLLEPRLYKGVVDENGQYREFAASAPIRRVVSPKTAAVLKMILKSVVDEGTGKAAQVVGLSVAGKTGTAQKIDPRTHQYSDAHYLASFCGFAPVDRPRLVIGVFLDEPQNGYWGGSEAAPLFARILKHAAPYLKLQSESFGPLATSRIVPRS